MRILKTPSTYTGPTNNAIQLEAIDKEMESVYLSQSKLKQAIYGWTNSLNLACLNAGID